MVAGSDGSAVLSAGIAVPIFTVGSASGEDDAQAEPESNPVAAAKAARCRRTGLERMVVIRLEGTASVMTTM